MTRAFVTQNSEKDVLFCPFAALGTPLEVVTFSLINIRKLTTMAVRISLFCLIQLRSFCSLTDGSIPKSAHNNNH